MRLAVVPLALVLVLALAAVAAADHLDPQERIRSADQRLAAAVLLRASDLPGFARERVSDLDPHLRCRALDESDLVVTGRATSPYWSRDYRVVGSTSAVYRTIGDSATAWRRATSAAGRNCLRQAFVDEFARQGETARISIERIALPVLGVERAAHRLTITGATPGEGPAVTLDVVLLRRGRAQAALLFAAVVVPPERARQIALARVVAKRMLAAARGSS